MSNETTVKIESKKSFKERAKAWWNRNKYEIGEAITYMCAGALASATGLIVGYAIGYKDGFKDHSKTNFNIFFPADTESISKEAFAHPDIRNGPDPTEAPGAVKVDDVVVDEVATADISIDI